VFANKGYDAKHHRTLSWAFTVVPFIQARLAARLRRRKASMAGQALAQLAAGKTSGWDCDMIVAASSSSPSCGLDAYFGLHPASLENSETASNTSLPKY
jgi:hypothetical protein